MADFVNLTCEPYLPREGEVLSLMCTAELHSPPARLDFDVRLVDNRLVITRLRIDTAGPDSQWPRDAVNATMLAKLPVAQLLLAVREWIVGDGRPNSSTSHAQIGHAHWYAQRDRYIGLLVDSADGPPSGRKVRRDHDYLRELATEYVRIAQSNSKNPRAELGQQLGLSDSGVATNVRLAREAGWLERPTVRGARKEIAAGRLLVALWEREGYPQWHERHGLARSTGRTTRT